MNCFILISADQHIRPYPPGEDHFVAERAEMAHMKSCGRCRKNTIECGLSRSAARQEYAAHIAQCFNCRANVQQCASQSFEAASGIRKTGGEASAAAKPHAMALELISLRKQLSGLRLHVLVVTAALICAGHVGIMASAFIISSTLVLLCFS